MATTTKNLGIVSPVPADEWNASTTYQKLNIITHNDSAYMAKQGSTGIEPGVTTNWQTYWMLLVSSTGGGSSVEVVQTTGQSETAVMSQQAVTKELNGKASTNYVQGNPTGSGTTDLTGLKVGETVYNIPQGGSSVEVVQTTGQSTTAVMSQKAVTDELAGKLGASKADVSAVGGLVKPSVAPLKRILVGIDISNTQNDIPINEEDFFISDKGLSLENRYGVYYLHTVVTSNYTFYFVNHYQYAYDPVSFTKQMLINSIAFNRYIGTNFRDKFYAFDLEIAISDGNNGLTTYRNSPNFIPKGNAISYFGNDGQEVTILASNFGTYVSDTVEEIDF